MGMNAMGAGFVVTARDAASSVFRKIGGSMGGLTKTAKSSFEKMNMGAGASLGAMGGAMVKAGGAMLGLSEHLAEGSASIDKNLGRVAARVGGTTESLGALRERLAGPEFTDLDWDVNKIASTFARLAEETGSADEAMKELRPSMEFATAAGIDAEQSAGFISDLLPQFKLNGDAAAATADKLAMTMRKYGILGNEIEPMLAGTAAGAALVNQSLDDTLLATGLIKQRFPSATKAAGALNMAMVQIADPLVQTELKKQGITLADNAGKTRPIVDIMAELVEKTKDKTEAQRASIMADTFGARAAGGLSVIMDTLASGVQNAAGETVYGKEAVAALRAELQATEGTTKEMADAMTNNYTGAVERSRKAGVRWADTWGRGAQDLRRPFLEVKAAAMDAFSTLLQSTDQKSRKNILGVVTALGGLVKVVGLLVVSMGAMKMFGISFTDLIFTFAKAILIIGPLVVLLGGLAVGMYAVYRSMNRNASGVGDSWQDMVGKIKLGWKSVVEIITNGGLSKATTRELNKTKNQGVLAFVRGFERFLERMKSFWAGLKRGFDEGALALGPSARLVLDRFKSIFGFFAGDAANTPEVLEQWGASGAEAGRRLASLGETALSVLGKLADAITWAVDYFSGITGEDVTGWIDGLVTAFNGLTSSLETIGSVLGWVVNIFSTLYHMIRVVGALLGDIVGMNVEAAGTAWDIIAGGVTGDKNQFQTGVEKARNFEFFSATQKEAGDTARSWGVRTTAGMSDQERQAYYAEERKGTDKKSVKELREQQQAIAAYMSTTGAEWAAGARPMSGARVPFESMGAGQQAEMVKLFDKMSKAIKDLGGRPVNLYVDREKIATAVGDSGTAQGTRSLDEGDALI
jgi:TP901 family phage tail tape measure protein